MHKKSIEAAKKLKEDDFSIKDNGKGRDELRTESINILRAKAQEHSAKMIEGIGINGEPTSHNTSPNSQLHHQLTSQHNVPHSTMDGKPSNMMPSYCHPSQLQQPVSLNCLS